MADDMFLTTLIGIIIAEMIIIASLKYFNYRQQRNLQKPETVLDSPAHGSGRYKGVERRAKKRSAGALYRQSNGDWAFR